MNRIKHFMILALALAMSLGAWAQGQQEVLLTTVTATGETSYSQSPDGIVTVTLNIGFYDDYDYGWLGGTVTVEANQGYTITRCVFKQGTNIELADDLAPFTATLSGYSTDNVSVETSTGHVNGDADHMIGITSIEVYGYAADPSPTVTHNADGSWTFTMPDYDAALNVTYYLQPNLAWTYNSAAMPAEGLTAYRGFELPVIQNIRLQVSDTFNNAMQGYFRLDQVSAPPSTWAMITDNFLATDMANFVDNSSLTEEQVLTFPNPDPTADQVYLIYGFDGSAVKYVLFNGTNVTATSQVLTKSNIYYIIDAGAKIFYTSSTVVRGLTLRYGSSNPAVVSFSNPNNMSTFSVNGTGEADIYAVFDGDTTFLADSVAFHVTIADPATLTLAKEGNGTVSALVGGGEETLLTTVTATGLSDYSQSPDGIVTVSLNNISNYSSDYGWIDNGTVTVEAPQGYTITRCVFRQYDKTPLEDDQAPFTATIADYTVSAVTSTGQVYGVDVLSGDNMDGISSIEVYGYASADSIVASATEGQYLVIPGAEVQVVATAQDGNYVSAWSDNRQPQHYTSDTNTITVGESMTLTATFAQNPLLTLEANGQGSVELEGYTPGETTYDITIDGNTVTNVSFPYQTTVSLHNLLMQVTGANPVIINSFESYGSADVTITISEPFDGSRTISYYYDEIGVPKSGSKTITCTANHSDAVYPDGVTAGTTANTYRVLPGTQLSVTATPAEGSYLAQWSDQTEPVEGDARLGSSHPYTMPATDATLTATFNEIPVLTLASNNSEWGTVEMEGAGSGSSNGYTIKFSANGNTIVKENVTLPKTYQCEYGSPSEFDNIIRELYGWTGIHGNENAIPTVTGTDAITPGTESSRNYPKFTINSAFQGTATVTIGYTNSSWESDNWPIEISFVPALPAGVLATTEEGTYRVLPGTQLSVTATPDEAHYFVNWDEETALNSNTAVEKTLTMGTDNTELTANFAAKPVLTLAQNESQWGEVTLEGYSSGTGSGTTLPDGVVAIGDNTYRVDYNTEVTVNAEATALHHVSGWQDQGGTELTGATYSDYFITTPENLFPAHSALTFTMTTDATARALFAINSYDVTASVAESDDVRGTVAIAYTDIDGAGQTTAAGASAEATAQGGSTSTLTATATDPGYHFVGWMDNLNTQSALNTQNPLTVTEAGSYTAVFDTNVYQISGSVATASSQWGSVEGSGEYRHFTTATLTAMPIEHYHFVRWEDGNTQNPRIIDVTGEESHEAEFAIDRFIVEWSSNDETMGVVVGPYDNHTTGNPIPRLQGSYGTQFNLTASPAEHHMLDHWSTGQTTNVITVTITENAEIVAYFKHVPYSVSVASADETMGTVSGSQESVEWQASTEISATANYGYHFVRWNDGNTANPRTVTINEEHDYSFTALFAKNQYTVTVVTGDATRGSVSGTTTVDYLTDVEISATANEHYHFEQWEDGNMQNPRTVTVTANATYRAYFAPDKYTVTGLADQGQGSVTGSGSYAYLSNAMLTAEPACGYLFDHWSDESTESTITFQVTGEMSYTAFFRPAVVDTVEVHDTTVVTNTVTVHDTTYIDIHDSIDVTVHVHDTTIVEVPVYVHDTTTVTVTEYVHDTTTVTVTEYVHDTTVVNVPVHDTVYVSDGTIIYVHDTTTVEVPVNVYVHDTTTVEVQVPVYVHDTTTIEVQVPVYVYDTTTVYDTTVVEVPVHDTTTVTEYEYIHDTVEVTVIVHDTIFIHDTIFVGIEGVDALDAKIYGNNGQIVVEGADFNEVILFDVNGRILARRQDEGLPLRFDIPASGAYLVKIGNHAARRIVMIR